MGENDGGDDLLDDLNQLLKLKQEIEHIKAEAKDPRLDSDSKLTKLMELQLALERVKALKKIVENDVAEDGNVFIGSSRVEAKRSELII